MNKRFSTIIICLLTTFALVGCNGTNGGSEPVKEETKYTDITADSIYGKLSNFSSQEVQVGDTLSFTVTPSEYFFIEKVTNNDIPCKLVERKDDGSAVYSTTIVEGNNKLKGLYSVDPSIDFVDKFKLNISDEVFQTVMSKTQSASGKGVKTDLDFRRSGIEQMRAPNKFDSKGKKVADTNAFVNYVDGDTTHVETFNLQYTVKIRYLGIDTPESTSEIEEWGLSASYFNKYIYSGDAEYWNYVSNTFSSRDAESLKAGATSIILVSQEAAVNSDNLTVDDLKIGSDEEGTYHATTDSNQRNLAYVWYATVQNPTKNDFRCLNLEMVYEGYSFGVGSRESTSDYYFKMFDAANLSAQINRRHIYSSMSDDNYYYYDTKGVNDLTLKELYQTAQKDATIGYLPISDFANKKTLYRITGYVSRKVGTSFYMQDKIEYDNAAVIAGTEKPYGIYVFTYSETPIKVGDEVAVVGAVSSYGGTFQMQGISYSTIDPDPVRDTVIKSRNHVIKPIQLTGAQFNNLMLPQVLVEITDNLWFYPFTSVYQGNAEDIGEGGSEEVNKYNEAYPFYNTSNAPIFYASFGETDNAASINDSESNIRYSNKIIRFTVDQEILVRFGATTCYSYKFFTGGSYWYNAAGAEYASADYAADKAPADATPKEAAKYQAVKKEFKRKASKPAEAGHGLICISHGYESTSGKLKMSAKICSGSVKDVSLTELDN